MKFSQFLNITEYLSFVNKVTELLQILQIMNRRSVTASVLSGPDSHTLEFIRSLLFLTVVTSVLHQLTEKNVKFYVIQTVYTGFIKHKQCPHKYTCLYICVHRHKQCLFLHYFYLHETLFHVVSLLYSQDLCMYIHIWIIPVLSAQIPDQNSTCFTTHVVLWYY